MLAAVAVVKAASLAPEETSNGPPGCVHTVTSREGARGLAIMTGGTEPV